MRNMSFSLTTNQVRCRTKTVTRRLGWLNLKTGEIVQPIEKGMGLKKGEKVQKINDPIRIIQARLEPLIEIYKYENDCALEGFPDMSPQEFVQMFCRFNRCDPRTLVNRIQFKYILRDLQEETFRQEYLCCFSDPEEDKPPISDTLRVQKCRTTNHGALTPLDRTGMLMTRPLCQSSHPAGAEHAGRLFGKDQDEKPHIISRRQKPPLENHSSKDPARS